MVRRAIIVRIAPDAVTIARRPRTTVIAIADVRPETIGSALEEALRAADVAPRAALHILLAPPLAEIRTLTDLPRLNTDALRRTVASQATRFFRAPDPAVRTDARRARTFGSRDVHAAAAPAVLVHALMQHAAGRHLRVRPDDLRGARLDLARPTRRTANETRLSLWIGVAMATLVACVSAGDRWLARANAAEEQTLTRMRGPARVVDALKAELSQWEKADTAFRAWEASRGAVLFELSALGGAIPPGSYLNMVEITEHAPSHLQVATRQPVAVISALRARGRSVETTSTLEAPSTVASGVSILALTVQPAQPTP